MTNCEKTNRNVPILKRILNIHQPFNLLHSVDYCPIFFRKILFYRFWHKSGQSFGGYTGVAGSEAEHREAEYFSTVHFICFFVSLQTTATLQRVFQRVIIISHGCYSKVPGILHTWARFQFSEWIALSECIEGSLFASQWEAVTHVGEHSLLHFLPFLLVGWCETWLKLLVPIRDRSEATPRFLRGGRSRFPPCCLRPGKSFSN